MPEYVDYSEYYDYDYPPNEEEIQYYIEYAKTTGGPILELGCGTGRILIPIAKAGFDINGIDISENMLNVAKKKIKARRLSPHVTLTCSDMANFELPQKNFSMVFAAARSFMHLFTQDKQIACLNAVNRHMRPNGLLLLDLYSPNFKRLSQPAESEYRVHREFNLPNGNLVVHKRRFLGTDQLNQVNSEEILFEEYGEGGSRIRTKKARMDTRYTFRFELQLLLERAGFEVQALFRDYRKAPYDGTGELLVVARK